MGGVTSGTGTLVRFHWAQLLEHRQFANTKGWQKANVDRLLRLEERRPGLILQAVESSFSASLPCLPS